MKAVLIFRLKHRSDDGFISEMVIWNVPHTIPGSRHRFKYRLYFGKGDHRHVSTEEPPCRFTSPEQLIADFMADVDSVRRKR